nr:MAG TPA: hypothetical protein [Caudoviricetes sp.]
MKWRLKDSILLRKYDKSQKYLPIHLKTSLAPGTFLLCS